MMRNEFLRERMSKSSTEVSWGKTSEYIRQLPSTELAEEKTVRIAPSRPCALIYERTTPLSPYLSKRDDHIRKQANKNKASWNKRKRT